MANGDEQIPLRKADRGIVKPVVYILSLFPLAVGGLVLTLGVAFVLAYGRYDDSMLRLGKQFSAIGGLAVAISWAINRWAAR